MDKVFLSSFVQFLQLAFGLSIKSTHETEWQKVTWWNGTEDFWEKSNVFGTEWQMAVFLLFDF